MIFASAAYPGAEIGGVAGVIVVIGVVVAKLIENWKTNRHGHSVNKNVKQMADQLTLISNHTVRQTQALTKQAEGLNKLHDRFVEFHCPLDPEGLATLVAKKVKAGRKKKRKAVKRVAGKS